MSFKGEWVTCPQCGGRCEHDLRTGELVACDVCGWPDAEEGNQELD